jgi:thiosulfate/3-mercaptopyruvate sulfurtransferase
MRLCLRVSLAAMFLCSLVSARAVSAADSRETLVVSPAWLAQHITDANLVLLHVGDKAEYDARHIRGARYVAAADIALVDTTGTGNTLQLPPADDLRARLSALGISDNSRVIVYYGKDRVALTTRVIFTLDAAGLGDRTSLLDGGMVAWEKDGHPTTNELPAVKAGTLSPLKMKPLVVDAAFVQQHLGRPKHVVIDGRTTAFYDGTQTGGSAAQPHKSGHIAGAKSVPYDSLTDASFKLKSNEELSAAFTAAGVKPGDTVVAYCHIGQQATTVIFAARILGFDVKLYDGSFEDWSRLGLPVEKTIK